MMKSVFLSSLVFMIGMGWASVTMGAEVSDEDLQRQKQLAEILEKITYQEGDIALGSGLATINLPQAYRFVDPSGTEVILNKLWGNPPSGAKPLGMIVAAGFDPLSPNAWCVVVDYEEDGYVTDEDAESIDYASLLKDMQSGTAAASEERIKQGYDAIELVGWASPPHYDKETHKMYWAKEIKFGSEGGENTLNYNLRLLGRHGVMVLNAIAGMPQLAEIEEATPEILAMIDFDEGKRYADYSPGVDKVAGYGLAALVAGGVAAKTGLLKGLFVALLAMKKFLIVGVIALVAVVKRFFSK
ncbi:MAG: DUF2167 domain-containing protein [Verrucomicrobiales bacterium]|nr:DUF2167 domain-containing protein [Verrucomicrobiales bacterium]